METTYTRTRSFPSAAVERRSEERQGTVVSLIFPLLRKLLASSQNRTWNHPFTDIRFFFSFCLTRPPTRIIGAVTSRVHAWLSCAIVVTKKKKKKNRSVKGRPRESRRVQRKIRKPVCVVRGTKKEGRGTRVKEVRN